jgi:two-component system LytT family sensor kinase
LSENLISYLFFKRRLRIIEQQAQQLNELNISKLTALQSQMNPHFIFNALNSIQDYIMMNERKLAGKYLGKFTDLMRIYLNYSQQKSISLQEEVEALQLYLELEQLRFGDSLEFEITIDQAVPIELISFPSLLI